MTPICIWASRCDTGCVLKLAALAAALHCIAAGLMGVTASWSGQSSKQEQALRSPEF